MNRTICLKRQGLYIFVGVLIYGFLVQYFDRSINPLVDHDMWSNQIRYVQNHDPRMLDFRLAYGHPGGTLIELGIFFHFVFGIPYSTSLTLTISLLVASASAACALVCSRLFPYSLWWLTTAFILLLDRPYFSATPPTAVVTPFIVLIVLTAWSLWLRNGAEKWPYWVWGFVAGAAAATRLDASFAVFVPLLILFTFGKKGLLGTWALVGAVAGFFAFDPFLWFMPIKHLTDFIHKFTMHYSNHAPTNIAPGRIFPEDLLRVLLPAACGATWFLILSYKRRLDRISRAPVLMVFLGIFLVAAAVILSSRFQSARYLAPITTVWEIFLPLFAFETFQPMAVKKSALVLNQHSDTVSLKTFIFLFIFVQLFMVLVFYWQQHAPS